MSSRLRLASTVTLALAAGFGGGLVVAHDPLTGEPQLRQPRVQQVSGPLAAATDCDALLEHFVDNALEVVGPWGWGGGPVYYGREGGVVEDDAVGAPGAPHGAPPPAASDRDGATSSETGTNVQEAGVDEPDVVKTDGRILVRMDDDDLTTYDVSGTSIERLGRVDALRRNEEHGELLLAGTRAIVLSQAWDLSRSGGTPWTMVRHYDLSDPAEPRLVTSQRFDGTLLSARLHGRTARVVLRSDLPHLDFVQPGGDRTEREALTENRRIVRESGIDDWLPQTRTDDGDSSRAVACEDVQLPEDFSGLGTVTVVGFDAADPDARASHAVAASSDLVYFSLDRMYLATASGWGPMPVDMRGPQARDGMTALHAFALAGARAMYLGSGEVAGRLKDRWSMDAVDGTLRVAVGPSSETGNFNSVVTFREQGDALVEAGRVDRLGVDEEIKAVRWFDDLAVVVTFRQVDPLYAVDLTDPTAPKALGELKIPGFSEYLHPIGGSLMVGIGTDASLEGRVRGGQAAVFDLADLTRPRQVGRLLYAESQQVRAGVDPRQFTWLPTRRTAVTVVAEYGASGGAVAWASVLKVGADGSLSGRMVEAAHGHSAVEELRAVPLPDGRVVLSSRGKASFLQF